MLRACPNLLTRHLNTRLGRLGGFSGHAAQRPLASLATDGSLRNPGDKLFGFTLLRTVPVPNEGFQVWEFRHDKTGARYMHGSSEDTMSVFSIGFRTNPPDLTGTPHILEHTVLTGSHKYPVRDPFFKMQPRSLSNDMNALTYPTYTLYPFSTHNTKDFFNLRDVYLDAVLYPLLREADFRQEGWRIGAQNTSAKVDHPKTNPLVFKGVVYNEMKGSLSTADSIFINGFFLDFIPDQRSSGGIPASITDLTYEQLVAYHKVHYHPSNSLIYTFGPIPVQEHLASLQPILDAFDPVEVDDTVIEPIDLSNGPINKTIYGPFDSMMPLDKQARTITAWISCDEKCDRITRFAHSIIFVLLSSGYGSPMHRAVVESGLATTFDASVHESGSKTYAAISASGVHDKNVPRIKEVFQRTVREIADKGFDKTKVQGLIHQIELGKKNRGPGFGYSIMTSAMSKWFNGRDPLVDLDPDVWMGEFKRRLEEPRYLEKLMTEAYLNDQSFTFTMLPSRDFNENLIRDEEARLEDKLLEARLQTDSQRPIKEILAEQDQELEAAKDEPQDLSVLPSIRVADMPRDQHLKAFEDTAIGDVKVRWVESPTNGVTFFKARNRVKLPDELRPYINLFIACLSRLGTTDMTVEEKETLIKLRVGALVVSYHTETSISDKSDWKEGFAFKGYALDQNIPIMFDLFVKVVRDLDLDHPDAPAQIKEMLTTSAAATSDTLIDRAFKYAVNLASATMRPEARIVQQTTGLTDVRFTVKMSKEPDMTAIIEKLRKIKEYVLLASGEWMVGMTCTAEARETNRQLLTAFLETRPAELSFNEGQIAPEEDKALDDVIASNKTFVQIPSQVSTVAMALPGCTWENPDTRTLAVVASLLSLKHLHPIVREKGGAYGAGAYYSSVGGTFVLYSSEDPNPRNTIQAMRNAGAWLLDQDITAEMMEEAKIEQFKLMDAPVGIASEGFQGWEEGITPEQLQLKRDQVFAITAEDVKRVVQRYLVDGLDSARLVVMGPQDPGHGELGWKIVEGINW